MSAIQSPANSRDSQSPMLKAFAALDEIKRAALERDITDLLERLNTAGRDSLVCPPNTWKSSSSSVERKFCPRRDPS